MTRYYFFSKLRNLRIRLFSICYILYLRALGCDVPFSVRFFSPMEIRGSAKSISIGHNASFCANVVLNTMFSDGRWGIIKIGENVAIGDGTIISSNSTITIGDNTSIAAYSYIVDHDHNTPKSKKSKSLMPIHIGESVWLGTHVIVLKGVAIGSESVVGAGSVVTKTIPSKSIAVGNPAKVLL
jgi:acetyltransferase-like isoleucine patch superfamily enzyme